MVTSEKDGLSRWIDQRRDPLVAHQHVRAAAEDLDGKGSFSCLFQDREQLVQRAWLGEEGGRPSQAKPDQRRQRLVGLDDVLKSVEGMHRLEFPPPSIVKTPRGGPSPSSPQAAIATGRVDPVNRRPPGEIRRAIGEEGPAHGSLMCPGRQAERIRRVLRILCRRQYFEPELWRTRKTRLNARRFRAVKVGSGPAQAFACRRGASRSSPQSGRPWAERMSRTSSRPSSAMGRAGKSPYGSSLPRNSSGNDLARPSPVSSSRTSTSTTSFLAPSCAQALTLGTRRIIPPNRVFVAAAAGQSANGL